MDMLIVYGSCYGTARRYAEKFAEMTGGRAYPYDARELPQADTVVCFCAMYAGGLKGLKRTAKRICAEKTSVFAVVTVGLADPDDGGKPQPAAKRGGNGDSRSAARKTESLSPARRHRLCAPFLRA